MHSFPCSPPHDTAKSGYLYSSEAHLLQTRTNVICVLCVHFCAKDSHPDSWVCDHVAWFTWHSQTYNLSHKSLQLFEIYGPDPQTSKRIPKWINSYCLNQSPYTLQFYCNRICLIPPPPLTPFSGKLRSRCFTDKKSEQTFQFFIPSTPGQSSSELS